MDHHCNEPQSQFLAPMPKYLSYHFFTPKARIVLGWLPGIRLWNRRGPIDFWLRYASGAFLKIQLDPRTLAFRYLNSAGQIQEGVFDQNALLAWANDGGVRLTTKQEKEEARFVVEFLRAVAAGKPFRPASSPFQSYWSHLPVRSGTSRPTIWTLLVGAVIFAGLCFYTRRRDRLRIRRELLADWPQPDG